MDNNKKIVEVINAARAGVVITLPQYNFRRDWPTRGAKHRIPFEQLEEILFLPGVKRMFESGTLMIRSLEDRIALGLEEEGATIETEKLPILTEGKMGRLLGAMPFNEFKLEINKLPKEQVVSLMEYAIEKRTIDFAKADFLKEKTGRDILGAIELNKVNEEKVPEDTE